eukprot:TRINITY_DN9982_c0_g1_i1.p1 TRINITY_DN9982_c0_g1~~TRINITY_DN9982_c0_g1_i1.p1  ORF type:complete len:298 (+),score=58.30 TRINITY_DN9982_c0_g1_i1:49-942(+)
MSEGRGRGKGRGRGRGRGRGKGRGPVQGKIGDPPVDPKLPVFTKISDLKQGNRSYDLILNVAEVNPETTRTEGRKGGRTVTTKVCEALVGDETGCIKLYTRQLELGKSLVVGSPVFVLNVKIRRAGINSWLEADNWSAIKPVASFPDLVPGGFETNFQVNRDIDRSVKTPPTPTFTSIEDLEPEAKGLYLIAKVLSTKSVGNSTEVQIADATASCTVLPRGAQHVEAFKEGTIVVIFNAHIEMVNNGFMRLVVDRWSDVKAESAVKPGILPATRLSVETPVKADNNRSALEWVLADD